MIRAVPLLDLIHPVPERHQPAIRCRRQITEHQRISRHRLLCLELSGQLTLQAADPRLVDSARVMSDQPRQPVIRADPPQEPGAIQRMKSRLRQVRGIPDVMKPRRRRQQLIRQAKPGSNLLTTSTSALDMPPPTRQHRIQIPLRQNTRLSCRHHDPERTTPNIRPCARPSALRCRIMPFLDQGGAARRRVRRSPRRALRLGAPARHARAGPATAAPLIFPVQSSHHLGAARSRLSRSRLSRSRPPSPERPRRRCAIGVPPTLDTAPARTGFGACEKDGSESSNRPVPPYT